MEVKERVLGVDLGHVNDKLYNTVGYSIPVSEIPLVNENWCMAKYIAAQSSRNAVVGVPAVTGTEHIVGTARGWGNFNRVFHVKDQYVNLPYLLAAENSKVFLPGYCRRYYRQPGPTKVSTQVDYAHLWAGIPLQQAKARAWNSMQPEFGSDFDLMNFLLELKDFKDVGRLILNDRTAIKGVVDQVVRFKRSIESGKIPKLSPTRTASTMLLTYSLAIKPLVKDVVDIASLVQRTVGAAQREFSELGKSIQTSNYSEVWNHQDTRTQPNGDYFWLRTGRLVQTKFTATLKYKYDYTMRSDFEAWCKYWGFSGSLSVAWNALPFSFLLDYVVRIGEALRWAERDDHVKLFTREYGESMKTTCSDGFTLHDHSRVLGFILNDKYLKPGDRTGKLIAGSQTSVYHRYPSEPYKGMLVPKIKLPSGHQTLIMMALTRLFWTK